MNQKLIMKKRIKSRKFSYILSRVSKRFFDISISATALVIVSPLLAYTAYMVKREDNGPILFKQKRSGLNNKEFQMYKFRSMKTGNRVIGTHTQKEENLYDDWQGRVPDDFIFKASTSSNPNITNTGAFIRKYSIDELPQIVNVLKGEMSLVGPRPEIVEITQHYDIEQKRRLDMKPGITGWAQVNGRSDINHGDKIQYDLWYINHWNFWLDIKILSMTFTQVIFGKGSI